MLDDPTLPPTMTPEEQATEAERQRIAAQAAQAREAGIMVQSSGRSVAASIASTLGGGDVPAAPEAAEPAQADRLALNPDTDPNNQQRKLDFIGQSASRGIYNPHTLETPASPHLVMAGSVIAASLLTGLNSDLPGMVVAQVPESVFDTVTGQNLLIPQGSRLIGSYDSVVAFGQNRVCRSTTRFVRSALHCCCPYRCRKHFASHRATPPPDGPRIRSTHIRLRQADDAD